MLLFATNGISIIANNMDAKNIKLFWEMQCIIKDNYMGSIIAPDKRNTKDL